MALIVEYHKIMAGVRVVIKEKEPSEVKQTNQDQVQKLWTIDTTVQTQEDQKKLMQRITSIILSKIIRVLTLDYAEHGVPSHVRFLELGTERQSFLPQHFAN